MLTKEELSVQTGFVGAQPVPGHWGIRAWHVPVGLNACLKASAFTSSVGFFFFFLFLKSIRVYQGESFMGL